MKSTSSTSKLSDSQYFYAACVQWAIQHPEAAQKHIYELTLDELEEIGAIVATLKSEGAEP
jgi:hypothetical protein